MKTTAVPKRKRLDEYPEAIDAKAILNDLRAQLNEKNKLIDGLVARFNERYLQSLIESEAAALLERHKQPNAKSTVLTDDSDGTSVVRLNQLRHDVAVLRVAISQQEKCFETLRLQLSKKIVAEAGPEHRTIVRKIAIAVGQVASLTAAERQFRDAIGEAGFSDAELRPMGCFRLGSTDDPNSAASAFLNEACEFGFITAAEAETLKKGGTL